VDRSGRHSAEQQNVLLVDDDSSGIMPRRRRLETRGYHVIKTSDVDAALTIARQVSSLAIFLTIERLDPIAERVSQQMGPVAPAWPRGRPPRRAAPCR
jgi:hypothetical protein